MAPNISANDIAEVHRLKPRADPATSTPPDIAFRFTSAPARQRCTKNKAALRRSPAHSTTFVNQATTAARGKACKLLRDSTAVKKVVVSGIDIGVVTAADDAITWFASLVDVGKVPGLPLSLQEQVQACLATEPDPGSSSNQ